MEVIWHILLTVCLGSTCIDQDVQWFDDKEQCFKMLDVYEGMPADGDWDTVVYQCKPINSLST
jgi:hypothetical protein